MDFRIDGHTCASDTAVIKNVQPDLEPGDFRLLVKAHLCTDGQGTSTTRTPAEIRTIMSDMTKVLSQCGIIVTISSVVTTVVPTGYVDDLDSGSEKNSLFGYEPDAGAIDIFFVVMIDSGEASGVTLTPSASWPWYHAGVAIADLVDGAPLTGQEVMRTLSHEITHYLLNHSNYPWSPDDHRLNEPKNLMFPGVSDTKRDLDTAQCTEMRNNHGED